MNILLLPTSQGELIRAARGAMTQKEFAKVLNVERSCLSRYESEKLGAPTSVLNFCLRAVAAQAETDVSTASPVQRALRHARQAVTELEEVAADPVNTLASPVRTRRAPS